MATTPKNLALVTYADATTAQPFYAPASGVNASCSVLSFTNNSTTDLVLTIIKNDGTSDFNLDNLTIPGGVNLRRNYYDIQREVVNGGGALKVQANVVGSFTVNLNGREIEV